MIVTVLMIATKINPFFREGFTKHYASVRAQAEKVKQDDNVFIYHVSVMIFNDIYHISAKNVSLNLLLTSSEVAGLPAGGHCQLNMAPEKTVTTRVGKTINIYTYTL